MPVRESAGEESGAVGCRSDGRKNGRVSVGKAGDGGQFEFLEWTSDMHLRHSKFVALRDDKQAMDVRREI
jgi:hypothetical protein